MGKTLAIRSFFMKDNLEAFKNYANAIYQNAMTGVQSVRDIEEKVQDESLKKEILSEATAFNKIADRVKHIASERGVEVEENNFFEKSRLWMSIKMATLMDDSTRHIAEMMLLGTVMGLLTCYKDKFDHKGVSDELDVVLADLERLEDKNYLNLKKFLKEL